MLYFTSAISTDRAGKKIATNYLPITVVELLFHVFPLKQPKSISISDVTVI